MEKYEKILKEIGLENNESIVYLEAIKLGTVQASIIGKKLGIPRTTARYACEELVKKQLMIKTQKGNSMLFTAENPQSLKNHIIIQKNKLEDTENKIDSIMSDLNQLYNPYTKLPKVTFYEGEEGIKKVLDDSLTSTETINSYLDLSNVFENFIKLNNYYAKKRKLKQIKKRNIYNKRDFLKVTKIKKINKIDDLTEEKYINDKHLNTYVLFMIYDNKISYITLKNDNLTGVIIENEYIYNFHKNMFNYTWQKL